MSVPCSDTYIPFCHILSRVVGFQMPANLNLKGGVIHHWHRVTCDSDQAWSSLRLSSIRVRVIMMIMIVTVSDPGPDCDALAWMLRQHSKAAAAYG